VGTAVVVSGVNAGRARAEAIVAGRLVDKERIGVNVADAVPATPNIAVVSHMEL
jgi:hypothetical protein